MVKEQALRCHCFAPVAKIDVAPVYPLTLHNNQAAGIKTQQSLSMLNLGQNWIFSGALVRSPLKLPTTLLSTNLNAN